MKSNINIFKRFLFDFTFCLLANSVKNQKFLFFIDLLQVFPLALIYINPFFSYLSQHSIFTIYFEQIYPYFYFFHQNYENQTFPACLFIFTIFFIIVAILRKQKTNLVLTILQIGLCLIPLLLFRIISQITNLTISKNFSQMSIGVKVCGIIMGIVVFFGGSILIYWSKSYGKCCDFVVGLLLFLKVNQYIVFGSLFIKNILNFLLYRSNPAKEIKAATQLSLFISITLLKFIKPLTSNYILLASIVGLSISFASFKLFCKINRQSLFTALDFEGGQKSSNYRISEIGLFKNIEAHIKNCAETHCICRQVFQIKNTKELREWNPIYEKKKAKLNCQQFQKSPILAGNFAILRKYIQYCSSSEDLDFQGYILLHRFHPKNIFEEYIQYHYIKKYKLILQKQPPNGLKMNIVNWDEDTNPYNDFFQIQNRICSTIEKIKIFWRTLLNYNGQNYFIRLIEEISNQLIKIKQLYLKIDLNYDQKDQVDHYYNIFKILSLHQAPTDSHIDIQKVNYFLVTKGQNIVNMTTNFTNLIERSREELIGHSYSTIMHPSYLYNHTQWAHSYLQNYKISENQWRTKIVSTGQDRIKVVKMSHTIIPYFSQGDMNVQNASDDEGIYVVSIISNDLKFYCEESVKKQIAFHLLLNRENLDILSYEYSIFEYFGVEPSIDISNKLLRSNLQHIFPNINRESLEKNKDRILLAKQNRKFFSHQENNIKVSKLCEVNLGETEAYINKANNSQYLEVKQVPSRHNKSLNILLLKFIVSKHKKAIQKPKNAYNQIDILKEQSSKQISNYQKQTASIKSDKKQVEIEQRIKIVVFFFSFCIFLTMITFHIITNVELLEIQRISNEFLNKANFYTDLEYTKAFFLNLYVGKNKIRSLEQNWKYGNKYSSIITAIKAPWQKSTFAKLQSIILEDLEKVVFSQLYQESSAIKKSNQSLKTNTMAFCYSILLIAFTTQILILMIFCRNQIKLEEALHKFLLIPNKQIQKNLQRIEQLEEILEVIQHNRSQSNLIKTQVDLLKIEKQQKLPDQSPSYSKIDYILQKRKTNQVNLSVNITKRNSSIQQILNSYIADSTIRGSQNFESSLSMLNRQEIKMNNQNINKAKYCEYISKPNIDFSEDRKSFRITFYERLKRNKIFIVANFLKICMKVGCFLFLLLFLQKNSDYSEIAFDIQEKLLSQPSFVLRILQQQYLGKQRKNSILQKQYEIKEFLQFPLPKQFDSFIEYSIQLDSTEQSLCSYLQLEQQITQCKQKLKFFSLGKNSLLQYIQERLRQLQYRSLNQSKVLLTESNQFNLALKIFLNIQEQRIYKFGMIFQDYNAKLGQIVQICRYITTVLLIASFILQVGQIQHLRKRKEKTKSLYKIVPQYIKQVLQIPNFGSQ